MQNLLWGLVALILLIVVLESSFFILHHANKLPKGRGKLKYPISCRYAPIIIIVSFGCGSVISMITKNEEWRSTLIVSLVIEVPSLLLFICFSLWEVQVQEDRFVYRNFIGQKKSYLFQEIEERHVGKWYSKVTQKKICSIPYFVPNNGLLRRRYKKYCLKNKGKI